MPGPRVANDFPFISDDLLKLQFDLPSIWNERGAEGLGEYGVFILWSYPINFILGILAFLKMNFLILERMLIVLFILLGSFSIWRFLSTFSLSEKAKLIGSLFYLINTYPILLIDGGQISIAIAYCIFPYIFQKTYQAVYGKLREKLFAGFMVSILGFFDVRFLLILFLLLLIRSLFELTYFWRWVKTAGLVGCVVVLLNAYWLIAYFKVPVDKDVFLSFIKISASLINIGHPIFVISPHWYKNIFGQITVLRFEFLLIPLLVLLAPILRRKDKQVAFWLLIAVISIFLAKGTADPFANLYLFLHANIPGFSFFRDSTKFFFLLTLSYAVLISMTSEELLKLFKNKKLQVFYLIIITFYLLYLIKPVFLNQMSGTFSIQPNEKEFQLLSGSLINDKSFGRVFWIPATAPLSYSDLNHPIVEAARIFNKAPFAFGAKGAYEIFNFLREAPYMGEVFDIAGIAYIAYPSPDTRRTNLSSDDIRYYYTFLDQLINLPWVEKKVPESQVPLLKLKNHQDKFFIAENTWIIFGSDEIFKESTKSAELKLSNNAVIFAEEGLAAGTLMEKLTEAKIVLNRKTITDLTASFIPKPQVIFPASLLNVDPNKEGWWKNDGKDLISWRDFLGSKYGLDNKDFDLGGGWAIGEKSVKLKVKSEKFIKGKVLLARVMESSRSGNLSFIQDNQIIGKISTKVDGDANVRWFEVGNLYSFADLVIKTEGDINIINALVAVDLQNLSDYKSRTEELKKQITDFKAGNILDKKSSVSYQKIDQTKYKVTVSDSTGPGMVVFSSSFHQGWKLNGQTAIRVYGFLNGFEINKDGEYILEFEPQRYVYQGLIIAGVTLSMLIFLLVKLR